LTSLKNTGAVTDAALEDVIKQSIVRVLKLYLWTNPWLLRWARVLRAVIILGPIRAPLLRLSQRFSKSAPQREEAYPTFSHIEVDQLVSTIENIGSAHIGYVPPDYLNQILAYCDRNNQASYWNPHLSCDAIDRIARNAKVLEIARKYLGAEPRLWLTQLNWTFSPTDERNKTALKKNIAEYNIHDFHYDTHDFKSLNIFFYFSDVTFDSGRLVFIRETHKSKSLREIKNISISDDVATQLYGDKIQFVLGTKGTIFAEDTRCYHKAAVCKNKNRLIASFDYVIRRKAPALPQTP
jgi:hypothetical protein